MNATHVSEVIVFNFEAFVAKFTFDQIRFADFLMHRFHMIHVAIFCAENLQKNVDFSGVDVWQNETYP